MDIHRTSGTLASVAFGLAIAAASMVLLVFVAVPVISLLPRGTQAVGVPLMGVPEGLVVLCSIGAVVIGHIARRRGTSDWRSITALAVGYGLLILFLMLVVAFFVTMSIWTHS
jgi:hypothetical protein